MVLWKLKSCPRCLGDLFIANDMDGWFEQCLQCSYRRELQDINEFDRKQNLRKMVRVKRR